MEETRKQILVRLPESLLEALSREAASERRSRAAQIAVILQERYRITQKPDEEAA